MLSEKKLILDYIKYKQLNWYGHVQKMDEEKLPRKTLERFPPGRRKKVKPQNLWMHKVTIWNGLTKKNGEEK